MPVEGQWRRARAPLPRRDKLALVFAAAATVVATVVAATVYLGRSSPPSNRHCVVTTIPSTMGGAVQKTCTRDAPRK